MPRPSILVITLRAIASGRRLATAGTAMALVLFAGLAHAADTPPPDHDPERSAIAEERSAIEARYAARDRECRKRFVVTSCVDEARLERRDGLDRLRVRQLAVDEARRKERTAERQTELAAKAAEDAQRDKERADRAASASSASSGASGASGASAASAPHGRLFEPRRDAAGSAPHSRISGSVAGHAPVVRPSAADRAASEAASRDAFEARQRKAAEHRQESEALAKKRTAEKPPATSLPVAPLQPTSPAASAASAR